MKEQTMKVKLSQLKIDQELIELRPINVHTVSKYRQAYREGDIFPLIFVNKKTMEITAGNHRYTSMLGEFGKDYETEVIVRTYKTRVDVLKDFAEENARHGLAFSGIEKRRIATKLLEEGCNDGDVSRIFGISIVRLQKWCGHTVITIGKGKTPKYKPSSARQIKAGPDIKGPITEVQYNEHIEKDIGLSDLVLIDQLIRRLDNGWIKRSDDVRDKFFELVEKANKFLSEDEELQATG